MTYEYLIFNAVVLAGPLVLSFDRKIRFLRRWRPALTAILLTSVPFLVWDIAVTGRHWWFNEQYTTGFPIYGLPPGEWLFFLTVPFACLFVWENLLIRMRAGASRADGKTLRRVHFACAIAGAAALWFGKEYTALMLFAVSASALVEKYTGASVFQRRQLPAFAVIYALLVLIFNGYLTARPLVLYGESYQLGVRLFTIPVEDFGYGWALMVCNIALFEMFKSRSA